MIRPRQNGRSPVWSTPLRGTRDSISKLRELAVNGRRSGVWFRVWRLPRRRRHLPSAAVAAADTIRDVSPSPSCSSFCQSTRANANAPTAGSSRCNNISREISARYSASLRRKLDENARGAKEGGRILSIVNSLERRRKISDIFQLDSVDVF